MNNNKYYASIKTFLILSVAIGLLIHIGVFLSLYFSDEFLIQHGNYWRRPPIHLEKMLFNLLLVIILAFVVYLYDFQIYTRLNLKKGWKIFLEVTGSLMITLLMTAIMLVLYVVFIDKNDVRPTHFYVMMVRNDFLRNIIVTLMVILSSHLMLSDYNRKKMEIDNEILISENLRSRYEVLKNQLNPHFIFNSLNTLQSLVRLDTDKASVFIKELSEVLRYTLRNEDSVTLSQEIDFCKSYCNLLQIRFGESIKINYNNIDGDVLQYMILPLSVQILIENAVKHNVISDKTPLTIDVTADKDESVVTVSNKIQPKKGMEPGNGIGLANLSERQRLKCGRDIDIKKIDGRFEVKVALFKPKMI